MLRRGSIWDGKQREREKFEYDIKIQWSLSDLNIMRKIGWRQQLKGKWWILFKKYAHISNVKFLNFYFPARRCSVIFLFSKSIYFNDDDNEGMKNESVAKEKTNKHNIMGNYISSRLQLVASSFAIVDAAFSDEKWFFPLLHPQLTPHNNRWLLMYLCIH